MPLTIRTAIITVAWATAYARKMGRRFIRFEIVVLLPLMLETGFAQTPSAKPAPKVYVDLGPEEAAKSVFSLRNEQVKVSVVGPVNSLPMHVVFVVDRAKHQTDMLSLERKYVEILARAIENQDARFSLVLTGGQPTLIAASKESFLGQVGKITFAHQGASTPSRDSLAEAIRAGIDLAADAEVRVMVVLSDGDDDVSGKVQADISRLLAKDGVRFFSILVAFHDFYGTHEHSIWGWHLHTLASQTRGGQYETNYQARTRDLQIIQAAADRIAFGTLLSVTVEPVSSNDTRLLVLKVRTASGQHYATASFLPNALVPSPASKD